MLPSEVSKLLLRTAMHPPLDTVYPGLRAAAAAALASVDPDARRALADAESVLAAVRAGRGLLQRLVGAPPPLEERVALLEEAAAGLAYLPGQGLTLALLDAAQEAAAAAYPGGGFDGGGAGAGGGAGGVVRVAGTLGRVLASRSAEVRADAYAQLADRVCARAARDAGGGCCAVVLDGDVAYEVAAYGLACESTRPTAVRILAGLPAACGRDAAARAVGPLLPLLSAYAGPADGGGDDGSGGIDGRVAAEAVARQVAGLVEAVEPCLPPGEVALGLVRLSTHADPATRMRAAVRLAEVCRSGGCWGVAAPRFVADPLGAALEVDPQAAARLRAAAAAAGGGRRGAHSGFEAREVLSLLGVFRSDGLAAGTRAAAAEQLARLLDDDAQLALLVRHGLLDAAVREADPAAAVAGGGGGGGLVLPALRLLYAAVVCSGEARAACREWARLRPLLPLVFSESVDVRVLILLALRSLRACALGVGLGGDGRGRGS
jgi:hypothetical protein